MESDFDVICVLIKRTTYLEHDGIRRQEWNPEPVAVKKIGDACVRLDRRIYFIYLGIAKTDDFHVARQKHHLEWCKQAEVALKDHFKKNGDSNLQPISGPDGLPQRELGNLAAV